MHTWMTFVVGMHLGSAREAAAMSYTELRYWYPLAKKMSDDIERAGRA